LREKRGFYGKGEGDFESGSTVFGFKAGRGGVFWRILAKKVKKNLYFF
jgi:hypothetical protein